MAADELLFDEGVLAPAPLCEFQGYRGAARLGGVAVLPWRGPWRMAQASGVDARPSAPPPGEGLYRQALVHLQKSRAATWQDLASAWQGLEPGGRLLLCGGNDLGVTSAVKRLAGELGQKGQVLANRRRARIVAFERREGPAPVAPEPTRIALPLPGGSLHSLHAEPGVFSARRLDAGTALLLETLAEQPAPERILDLGCGIGPLGLWGLARWPDARATLLDGDARACASAARNAASLGVEERCRVDWWDAEEPCPESGFDLALVNPPFHGGKAVDLRPARSMFSRLAESLSQDGRALIVANRSLPYESSLSEHGAFEALHTGGGYKIIAFTRGPGAREARAGRSARGR